MSAVLRISVVYCPAPGQVDQTAVQLAPGATLADALAASGLSQRHAWPVAPEAGIHGRIKPLATPLRDGDRVELYRPLTVDPKEARRLRYRRDRAAKPARPGAGEPKAG